MHYKIFGKTGLRVSELCLGTMTFGEDWGWGADKEGSRQMLHHFLDAGGNFIDTANFYTQGNSERILGELTAGIRNELVIATKYSLMTNPKDINAGGNQRKNMTLALEASLKRLNTDYVDVFWVHIWDKRTPIEETLYGLKQLVDAGKALHIGISDAPAWVIAKANTLAEHRHMLRFQAMQMEYSLVERNIEREHLPLAVEDGMSLLAWSPLGGGLLTGKYTNGHADDKRLKEGHSRFSERNLAITEKLVALAAALGQSPSVLALSWLRGKHNVIPIVGARKPEQLLDNLKCLEFDLPAAAMQELDEISKIPYGFPMDFINSKGVQEMIYGKFDIR